MSKDATPFVVLADDKDERWKFGGIKDNDERAKFIAWVEKLKSGHPFFEDNKGTGRSDKHIHNLNVAQCFNCESISIWLHERMLYPQRGEAPPVNPDISDEIRRDYEEASAILDLSPRGATALIRLAIQKLCRELGQPGENINDDIAALVTSGLDPRVQKALDAVRVIGNNAVHPGQIDLRDDRATAESMFRLLNLIAEKTISEPKHVDEVYESLPESARAAIQKRDGKT